MGLALSRYTVNMGMRRIVYIEASRFGVLGGRKAWKFAETCNGILTQMGVRNSFPSLFLLLRESVVQCLG